MRPLSAARFGIGIHRTELVDVENLPALANAPLRVDDGTRRLRLDLKSNDSHRDSKDNERTTTRNDIECTLHKAISYAAANSWLEELNHIVAGQQLCQNVGGDAIFGELGLILTDLVNLSGFMPDFFSVSSILHRVDNKLHIENERFRIWLLCQGLHPCRIFYCLAIAVVHFSLSKSLPWVLLTICRPAWARTVRPPIGISRYARRLRWFTLRTQSSLPLSGPSTITSLPSSM